MQDADLWKFFIFESRIGTETDGQTPGSRYSVRKVIIIWVNLSENYVLKFARVLNVKIEVLTRGTPFPLLVSHKKNRFLKIITSMPLVFLAYFR